MMRCLAGVELPYTLVRRIIREVLNEDAFSGKTGGAEAGKQALKKYVLDANAVLRYFGVSEGQGGAAFPIFSRSSSQSLTGFAGGLL
jgi:hypothetical protein